MDWQELAAFVAKKTDKQLQTLVLRHREADKMTAPLCVTATEELAKRTGVFNFPTGINYLMNDVRLSRSATCYSKLAVAAGVIPDEAAWNHTKLSAIPLSTIIAYCASHGFPILTALIEDKNKGVTDRVLAGFAKGLDEANLSISEGMTVRDYYMKERQRAYDWVEQI
jgi:hypothetical protein